MQLNQDQILELYKFTRAHFVVHYDLQTELVDHLANGIEQQWQENPNKTFKEALTTEFKKFGVFGFHDVIAERTKALSKRYYKLLWCFFKEWFRLPKLAITLSVFFALFAVLHTLANSNYGLWFSALLFSVLIGGYIFRAMQFKKHLKAKEKRWMLEDLIFNQVGMVNVLILPVHLFNGINSWEFLFSSIMGQALCALIFTVIGLFALVSLYVLPKKAEELLAETYPEYKLV